MNNWKMIQKASETCKFEDKLKSAIRKQSTLNTSLKIEEKNAYQTHWLRCSDIARKLLPGCSFSKH